MADAPARRSSDSRSARGADAPGAAGAETWLLEHGSGVADALDLAAAGSSRPHEILRWALKAPTGPSVATSVRLPGTIDEAAKLAVAAGWASSVTELVVEGLRARLVSQAASELDEQAAQEIREALDEHYAEHPDARPSLPEIVDSAAELEGHPAAAHPALVRRAVEDLGDDALVEDVLAWVRGALSREVEVTR